MKENETPYGSEPVGSTDNSVMEPEEETAVPEAPKEEPVEAPKEKPQQDSNVAKLEKMLKDSQSMIGKQSSEIGALRSQLESFGKKDAPQDDQDRVSKIMQQMDEGDISISEGMRQVLAINSQTTASQVMSELSKQRQEEETARMQKEFFDKNPDYQTVIESGELNKYM